MSDSDEIKALRAMEAMIERRSRLVDVLQRKLISCHPADLRILCWLPYMTWAVLPPDWQKVKGLRLAYRYGIPPADIKGPIAVDEALAREICGEAR